MKKVYFFLIGLFLFSGVNAQVINFTDANFKAKLLEADSSNTIAKDLAGNYFKIDANSDGEIEVSEALQVDFLDVSNSSLYSIIGISNFSNLRQFFCTGTSLASADLSSLTNLLDINVQGTQLTSLNVNGLTDVYSLRCDGGQLTSLDVSSLVNLQQLFCQDNDLSSLDVSGLTNLTYLECSFNQLPSLDVSGLINLTELYCSNNQISSLNLNGLTNFTILDCGNNQLLSLDVSSLINLTELYCNNNQISSLNTSTLINLIRFYCYSNQLSSLDVSGLTNLKFLECENNQITSLNVSDLTNLEFLMCNYNQITLLNTSGSSKIDSLYCRENQLTSLDLSSLTKLKFLECDSNQLTSLFIKNGIVEISASFNDNPNLKYICADDSQIVEVQNRINIYGYTNCTVNSYCSFVPGGEFYTIQGNNRYDSNNNGCDVTDINASNLKLSISDGTTTGSLISNETGAYSIPVDAWIYTVTPVFEYPSYFNVSPTSVTVDFPTQASPFTQDFCVTANGVHPDLEVTLLPIDVARPGFEVNYKIIYKNKGTTTQSGSVNLTFDDAVLDFVSANPTTNTQTTNNLSWDYSNLLPFETREIELILNVNAPTDTPAVNSGDILDYTATITSPATDDTPTDNTFTFNQTVVNSLDPNDKTCLEGTTITPTMVGEYVHYVIRFENTGTFPAENIVVKDMIDLAKFDLNSLVPIKGSHEFVTNITAENKVEFIFENINLPFDDANNDGFVAFKIKTKSSLVLGDTFTNSASIYFDYNFPIVTNTATTTVQTLGTPDFEFEKYFTVFPNPASDTLNLSTKSGITVNNIAIYNTLGQLVIAIPNAQSVAAIDVSGLRAGNYFIKMTTDKGTSNTKFIKN